ncbi:NAD(P)/FAD-dependent oxidoreductase [Umboniibacter marinipuniceus]|uniref:Putative NAD/FAD-binding protein n=1 Tax=Umboniibacter marinipuniceus TaxID=569599 RepID=A0A3M0AE85_9GAMM|nr:FAD-dependent oxidoreductase [Umboniibacter marinipuniceus]RMA82454.1 putative NAD/FAD-binding protein [Umboniibacter marinipuniceus]
MNQKLKIAVIGGGISGLTAAHLLSEKHTVSLFEAGDYLGGHTNTEDVEINGKNYAVNTGFIVFNDWTYPNFIKLMDSLGVESEDSDMSFSVHCENSGLEYAGTNLTTLFAQKRNLFKPSYWKMLLDIIKFNKQAKTLLEEGTVPDVTLGEFIDSEGLGRLFRDKYIIPMGAAIWSASEEVMLSFPLPFFLKFFNNHGLLNVEHRPQWRVISGGSRSYVAPLSQRFAQRAITNRPVDSVVRSEAGVRLNFADGELAHFDEVVFACHSDQALALLENSTELEREILGAIPYQHNDVVLHTDTRLMPKRRAAWASWNYHIPQRLTEQATVTYHMNRLQNFADCPEELLVTLNRSQDIDPSKIIKSFSYAHPVFSGDGEIAQGRWHEISGHHRSHFCGAYWRNGFHEDGVFSALRVAEQFGIKL